MSVRWLIAAGAIALVTSPGAHAAEGSSAEKEILGIAARQSWAFCHPKDLSKGGCELHAALMKDEWIVIASPKLRGRDGIYNCCAPDYDRFFYFSRTGAFLREDTGTP